MRSIRDKLSLNSGADAPGSDASRFGNGEHPDSSLSDGRTSSQNAAGAADGVHAAGAAACDSVAAAHDGGAQQAEPHADDDAVLAEPSRTLRTPELRKQPRRS
jgi:hypothetical protein